MIVSQEFLNLLVQASKINTKVALTASDRFRITDHSKSHILSCALPEGIVFDETFGIYDLPEFIRSVKLIGVGCDLVVDDSKATLTGNNAELTFYGCDPQLIDNTLEKDPTLPPIDATMMVQLNDIKSAITASKALGTTHVTFKSISGVQSILIDSLDNEGGHSLNITIGADTTCKNFSFSVPTEVFNIPPSDYEIGYCDKGIAVFKHPVDDYTHYLGVANNEVPDDYTPEKTTEQNEEAVNDEQVEQETDKTIEPTTTTGAV